MGTFNVERKDLVERERLQVGERGSQWDKALEDGRGWKAQCLGEEATSPHERTREGGSWAGWRQTNLVTEGRAASHQVASVFLDKCR